MGTSCDDTAFNHTAETYLKAFEALMGFLHGERLVILIFVRNMYIVCNINSVLELEKKQKADAKV